MATILLVDDDPDVLETLAAIVKAAGHAVIKSTSGTAALDILDGDIPLDLMLTDIIMPGLNGFNLARMARLRRESLKILYLTGFFEEVITLRDGGAKYGKLLRKPIIPQQLRAEIDSALAQSPS